MKPATRYVPRGQRVLCALAAGALLLVAPALASAQAAPTAGFPPDPAPAPEPAPQAAASTPATSPPPPPSTSPPPVYTPSGAADSDAPPPSGAPPPRRYRLEGTLVEEPEAPPPPPLPPEHHGFKMPPWSVRIDPFTWLIEGRLGFELEVGVLKWLSVEMVPVFVTAESPPTFSSFSSRDSGVSQQSNGLGPISGTSIGAGFWLGGNVLHGYVLRAIFTDYGYTYVSRDNAGEIDRFSHTDRWLMGMLGSNSTFGPFTIAGGIGLGVELNKQGRCAPPDNGCKDLEIRLSDGNAGIVSPSFYPVVLAGRISLGVTFD